MCPQPPSPKETGRNVRQWKRFNFTPALQFYKQRFSGLVLDKTDLIEVGLLPQIDRQIGVEIELQE